MVKAAGELAPLGTSDRKKRDGLIAVVTAGERTFIEVGNALRVLRDDKLYRETHGTFEDFCKSIWGFAKSRAYQLMDAASAASAVSTIVDKNTPSSQAAPVNEGQARVLAELKTPQQQATVWAKAVEAAPKDKAGNPKVTAAIVKKTAQAMGALPAAKAAPKASAAPAPKPKREPDCSEGGHEPEEAIKHLDKLTKSLGDAARAWGDVNIVLGESRGLRAIFDHIDAACISLKLFAEQRRRKAK